MILRCKSSTGPTGENFRLLQAAYLGKAGDHLVDSLGNVESHDYILYAVFSRSENINSKEPVAGSALCIFPMQKVNEKILSGVQSCFYGDREDRGLKHIERAEDRLSCYDLDVSQQVLIN